VHIAYGVPLALPFLAWSMPRLARDWRPAIRLAAMLAAGAVCVAPAVSWLALAREAWSTPAVPTARGPMVWFGPPGTPEMLARVAALPPEDGVFFYPTMALAPMLTGREDATPYDTYQPGYTRPSEYRAACRAAIRGAAWVVVDRNFTDPALIRRSFPAVRDAAPPETMALEHVLDTAYDLAARDGKLELRQRRVGVDEAVCDGIAGK